MERFICIHGHFYQPPRENAWLERVEIQDSAYPYHDWNERIAAECYAPNAASRILDDQDRITRIVNNYSRISFNFGPTLLSWLESHDPDTYAAILEADRRSRERFSGHGSAMAQAFNHAILPLCAPRDQVTQVRWGIRDFRHRFGRDPEGMWLPETAVDTACLEVLARHGIVFTVLAPSQAAAVRRIGEREWTEFTGSEVDPRRAYRVQLPSGRSIDVFFYDGPIARAVAFERLLSRGEQFASRLLGAFDDRRQDPQLVHIATDGETYGHHHRFGDMALAFALHQIETGNLARVTNYAEFLALNPPTHEARIRERTSWSCAHGLGRWTEDCGCHSGIHSDWNQKWRAPLRRALDHLRDTVGPRFEERAARLLRDPWAARDDYIDIVLDRSPASIDAVLGRHARTAPDTAARTEILELLEMQRHLMLMYTSCGWFFDELSGIETIQILQYACRAMELGEALFDEPLEPEFLDLLAQAPSNLPDVQDGRKLYVERVLPSRVDAVKFGANHAASHLFEDCPSPDPAWGFEAVSDDPRLYAAGNSRLALGKLTVRSRITNRSVLLEFGCVLFGEHNLSGGVRPHDADASFEAMRAEVSEAYSRADFPEVLRKMDRHFGENRFSLKTLFRDEQRLILDSILESTLEDTEQVYRRLYEQHAPLMRFLKGLETPLPRALRYAAEFVLSSAIRRLMKSGDFDRKWLGAILDEARSEGVALDATELSFTARTALESKLDALAEAPEDLAALEELALAADLTRSLPFDVPLGRVQTGYYRLYRNVLPDMRHRAALGDAAASEWVRTFLALGSTLRFALE